MLVDPGCWHGVNFELRVCRLYFPEVLGFGLGLCAWASTPRQYGACCDPGPNSKRPISLAEAVVSDVAWLDPREIVTNDDEFRHSPLFRPSGETTAF